MCEFVLLNGCHAAFTIFIPLFDEYISEPTVIILSLLFEFFINNLY